LSFRRILVCALLFVGRGSYQQTVSPVIVEYKEKAEGTIALTNNTLLPMAVTLEPRSFSIAEDGSGAYRSLDPRIHIEFSSTSALINPGQTYYVFYKARSKVLPAWFTIYSTFSPARQTDLDIHILLPHTVYLYPKKPKSKVDVVDVKRADYLKQAGKIVCEIRNATLDLERVEEIRIASDSKSITSPGFPLLPGATRHLELDWKGKDPPRDFELHMDRSTLKLQLRFNN
jgi:hypothetical protein